MTKRLYADAMDVETYQLLGLDHPGPFEVNGRTRYEGRRSISGEFDDSYSPCPEATPGEDVPGGQLVSLKNWQLAKRYPNTSRDIRFYLSPGVKEGATDLNLMVFNDGALYLSRNGRIRAANVLDSMHHQGELPDTLAIFINPGRPLDIPAEPETQEQRDMADHARAVEYDCMRPDYGDFLLQEIIPLAEQTMSVLSSRDPVKRMMVGLSSGGIGAFTVAWHFPDQFQRVLCHCGSFTNIMGGHNYPWLIRSTPRKPIRVFMQSGENDINGIFGNWPLANKEVASALEFSGYDYRFEFGEGGHSLAHGGAIFADSLRWLLR